MPAKSSPLKMFATVAVVSLVAYVLFFSWLEHQRHHNGPWEVTFFQTNNSPALQIHQPKLGLTNITIVFASAAVPTNLPQTLTFQSGQVAPLDLPFGRCIFLDTLFLPGTVTCELFGHEVQFMPRTLTIDRGEHAWVNGEKILLTNRVSATLPGN